MKIAGNNRGEQPREFDALPIGTRVRDKRHGIAGTIDKYEWKAPGILSAIPYSIRWDNPDEAHRLRGMFNFWETGDNIEAVK